MRSETDPAVLHSFAPQVQEVSVAPDGRRFAYVQTSQTGQRLIVLDTATLATRTVIDFAGTGETAGSMVWSVEGTNELLLAVHKLRATPPTEAKEYSRLVVVGTDDGRQTEIARTTSGLAFRPIAYRRQHGEAAAIESGPGGFAANYVFVRGDGTVSRQPFDADVNAASVHANADGSRILAIGPLPAPRALWWWPIHRFDDRHELRAPDHDVRIGLWRPGTDEIVVDLAAMSRTSPAAGIEVWSVTGVRRAVATGSPLAALRVDGSAAIGTDTSLIDLATGAKTPLPGADRTQTPYAGVRF
jgi:hypothetical protein